MPRPITRRAVDGKCPMCGGTDLNARKYCRPCVRLYDRAYRARDPEKRRAQDAERSRRWRRANPEKKRAQKLRQDYGLTQEQFEAMLRMQGGACAICQQSTSDYCVDHCHVTGRVRGILCRSCNAGIGQFRDNPKLFLDAADYVEEHGGRG
jgi:hypothetical protein